MGSHKCNECDNVPRLEEELKEYLIFKEVYIQWSILSLNNI